MKPTEIDHDELLRREAEIARKRLLRTVDELDERKHRVEGMSVLPVLATAAFGVFVLTGFVDGVRHWSRRRRRLRALRRFMRALRGR